MTEMSRGGRLMGSGEYFEERKNEKKVEKRRKKKKLFQKIIIT